MGDGSVGEALFGDGAEQVPDLIVTEVNETSAQTVQGVSSAGGRPAAITSGWQVSGGDAVAE